MSKLKLIQRARSFCETNKHRFTEPRKRVLSILASSHRPMGAYDILNTLSAGIEKINPPTVYRAIEFWNKHGFIHKIDSKNTYVACCEHQQHANFCIFICDNCQDVQEILFNTLPAFKSCNGNKHAFTITRSTTEIHGQCGQCRLARESRESVD